MKMVSQKEGGDENRDEDEAPDVAEWRSGGGRISGMIEGWE